jgi:hypothetical protein
MRCIALGVLVLAAAASAAGSAAAQDFPYHRPARASLFVGGWTLRQPRTLDLDATWALQEPPYLPLASRRFERPRPAGFEASRVVRLASIFLKHSSVASIGPMRIRLKIILE